MARKESVEAPSSRGFDDVIGIVLLFLALLLFVAMLTFDLRDLAQDRVPANEQTHNLIGPFGAWMAHKMFRVFGAGAFLLPILFGVFGAGCIVSRLHFLPRRWPWAVLLLFASLGLLDLHKDLGMLQNIHRNLNPPSVGGYLGLWSNQYLFHYFGKTGATILYLMFYLVSLLFLTNFHLSKWMRRQRDTSDKLSLDEGEKELEKRARKLEQDTKKLQDEVSKGRLAKIEAPAKSGLGADLQPIPEPTVRDLSLSKPRKSEVPGKQRSTSKAGSEPEPVREILPPDEVVVIPAAKIIAATTTEEVLGKDQKPSSPEPGSNPETFPALKSGSPTGMVEEKDAASPQFPPATPKPKAQPKKPKPISVASTPLIGDYRLPPLDFLQYPDPHVKPSESTEDLMANARLMQSTLAQFDIEVALGDITKGPTITRYELHPSPGVRLEKISALNNNIAAALKAERINILAPVPGKSSVGIEVPNSVKTKVIMRDLMESEEWQTTKARIPLALGKDVYGHPIIADLSDMPHLLIAGSTGSGKSVCINSIITSLLYRFSPDELRFVMIDPKVVELQHYNALPHLVVPVVNDPKKVILALRWVVNEMEKRYQIFAKVGVRNIKSFNDRPKHKPLPPAERELPLKVKKEKVEAGSEGFVVELDEEIVVPRDEEMVIPEKLSYIVVIIDELADLMLVAPADVEMAIARITQMARAAGIHCIVATQRPSVDVITGVIKANIPARIAFQVAAKVDSRTILDAMGADKLLGKGDMLYLPPGSAKLIRAQGVLITDHEIQSIVDFIAGQGKPSYEIEIHQQLSKAPAGGAESGCDEDEDLIQQCIEVIRSEQKASVSLMQRRLRLGYTRAARIMDELENRGIVGPSKGAEPRDILIDLDTGENETSP